MNSTPIIDHPEYLIHRQWMSQAIALAQAAGEANEVPVGAVIVDSAGNFVASAQNRRERDKDPTAHAEILALRQAGQVLHNWYLSNCTLYVTLEPCPMCAGAIIQARLKLIVYGADDPKTGAIRTVANIPDSACSYHRIAVIGGILESTCRAQLQAWFAKQRQLKHKKAAKDEEL
ncbi:tRNA adenosine(34) deaminase TadA [Chroococcidiopsis sp. TS-821]|uniref:tRNA adenosine(34) deaminase TadA n=1 Tax=Chroococcidiopsis sp. TS-821 TaxID=1378066 RepID=UPI001FEF1F55|nr:tRNA adenosine(34) deaminase TadA [Chroococcidiopsis sp. TS-821]